MDLEAIKKYTSSNRQVEVVKIGADGAKERYESAFCKSENDHYLISPPKRGDKLVKLEKDEVISLYIYAPEGIYNLKCVVLEIYEKYYKISLPKSIQRAQRREYIRVNMRIPMKITAFGNSIVGERTMDVYTNDISARGANFLCNGNILPNEKIRVRFNLKGREIETLAALVYCREKKAVGLSGVLKFAVALNFTSVSQADIDFIVKECFAHQAKMRRLMLDGEEEQ